MPAHTEWQNEATNFIRMQLILLISYWDDLSVAFSKTG